MSQTFLHLDARMSFTSSSTSACSTSPNASTFSHCPSTKAANAGLFSNATPRNASWSFSRARKIAPMPSQMEITNSSSC